MRRSGGGTGPRARSGGLSLKGSRIVAPTSSVEGFSPQADKAAPDAAGMPLILVDYPHPFG